MAAQGGVASRRVHNLLLVKGEDVSGRRVVCGGRFQCAHSLDSHQTRSKKEGKERKREEKR